MFCSSSTPRTRRRTGERRGPRGFTLVELLVVMLVLAILIALLLPAINAALRTAKNAAVGGEINQLSQALAQFKTTYGDYPPSRIYLSEDGNLLPPQGNTQIKAGDITYAQLGQRSIAAMRKFFPRVSFNLGTATGKWYDFNGDGLSVVNGHPQQYILQGDECLVFFLGGIPQVTSTGLYGMTGFGSDPTNPFTNSVVGSTNYSANRKQPFFEFVANRLILDPHNPYAGIGTFIPPLIPGYLDSLGNNNPGNVPGNPINFYAYFSSYGNGNYDPNDVNYEEFDVSGTGPTPLGIELAFHVNFPILPVATPATPANSPAPNPYTSSTSASFNANDGYLSATYQNPQSYQIISSGLDGLYGVGGQYNANNAGESLPWDSSTPTPYNTTDTSVRYRERDNVTNFHNGRLE